MDDAFLSLGGSILNWKSHGLDVRVYNIFTVTNWVTAGAILSFDYKPDCAEVTELRKKEESEVARFAGYKFECWDFPDGPLRSNYDVDQLMRMESEICEIIRGYMNPRDQFFFPVGITHQDHIMIARLGRNFLGKGYSIFFYEDLPYVLWDDFNYPALWQCDYFQKDPHFEIINADKKKQGLKIYRSQIKYEWIAYIMTYAYNIRENQFYERFWRGK